MLKATLYLPGHAPQIQLLEDSPAPGSSFESVRMPAEVPALLRCAPQFVDVLASGHDYVVYSIFDAEGEINLEAMEVTAKLSGVTFDVANEDEILRGLIVVVSAL